MHQLTTVSSDSVFDPTDSDVIELKALSDDAWRVRDRRIPRTSSRSLLGFIEAKGATFEVMVIDHPWDRMYFGSLADAATYFHHVQAANRGS